MAVLVEYCNIWKSNRRIAGIFTDRDALNKFLYHELSNNSIMLNKDIDIDKASLKELHIHIDYLSLTEINLNEKI